MIPQSTQANWSETRAKNWHLFMPPARPSKGEAAQYEKAVLRFGVTNAASWALLGSTPEIRSLAAKCRVELLCIDKNAKVFKSLAPLSVPPTSESLLCEDWLTAVVHKPVDAIFGDGSLNMLSADQHGSLIRKIHSMLRPKGLAFLRIHLAEAPQFSSPQEVFEWRRTHNPREPVFSATRTHLDMLWLERDSLKISFADAHQKIRELHQDCLITDDEFQAYEKLLRYNVIELHYTTRARFEEMIADYFSIEEIRFGGDYSQDTQHPVYVLRKR